MSRRKTASELKLAGTWRPDRHKDRRDAPAGAEDLGPAPAALSREERLAWAEIAAASPSLTKGDRLTVELLARALTKIRSGDFKAADVAQATALLAKCGLTPQDRLKIPVEPQAKVQADEELSPLERVIAQGRRMGKAIPVLSGRLRTVESAGGAVDDDETTH
jgi:hypothetical protein